MKLSKLIRATIVGLCLAAMPLSATGVTSTPTPSPAANRLDQLKSKGSTEIDRRLANLKAALDKLSASTKLTDADKATLTKQINDEVSGLTALKTKLATE